MRNPLDEKHINRLLRNGRLVTADNGDFEKVWFKIEDRLNDRKKHFWNTWAWKPQAHPGSWAAMAACLCVILTGFQYQLQQADNRDLDSYLISISEPTTNLTREPDGINVTSLLDEPLTSASDVLLTDETPAENQASLYQ